MQSLLDLFAPDLVHLAGRRRCHRLRCSSTSEWENPKGSDQRNRSRQCRARGQLL